MQKEPSTHHIDCSYCGDAAVNHTISYYEKFISITMDTYTTGVVRYAPRFLKNFVNWIPTALFRTFVFLGMARFSSDMDRVVSFRSGVIWEEAKRRGIDMQQIIFLERPLDYYRAVINSKVVYFESIPSRNEYLDMKNNWDDKFILKRELSKHDIPIPRYVRLSPWSFKSLETVFSSLEKPIIVKPQVGSRGRHTVTNIKTFAEFKHGVRIARQLSPYIIIEEYLKGHVCRATLVGGVLAGFYVGRVPTITGDGVKTVRELIEEKDANRPERVEKIRVTKELEDHINRFGHTLESVPALDVTISLSHRQGRLFGGETEEMIDTLHPSFIPILEKAAQVVELSILGFDCIIPDPTKDQASQKWGIIECNTLPFIDLHYYALIGKPRNIAGMVWDLWK